MWFRRLLRVSYGVLIFVLFVPQSAHAHLGPQGQRVFLDATGNIKGASTSIGFIFRIDGELTLKSPYNFTGFPLWSLMPDSQHAISGTTSGIYESTDFGCTWNPIVEAPLTTYYAHANRGKEIMAIGRKDEKYVIFHSIDNGKSFKEKPVPPLEGNLVGIHHNENLKTTWIFSTDNNSILYGYALDEHLNRLESKDLEITIPQNLVLMNIPPLILAGQKLLANAYDISQESPDSGSESIPIHSAIEIPLSKEDESGTLEAKKLFHLEGGERIMALTYDQNANIWVYTNREALYYWTETTLSKTIGGPYHCLRKYLDSENLFSCGSPSVDEMFLNLDFSGAAKKNLTYSEIKLKACEGQEIPDDPFQLKSTTPAPEPTTKPAIEGGCQTTPWPLGLLPIGRRRRRKGLKNPGHLRKIHRSDS
ncbi:MAG: hypothetical protein VYA34_07225 [Myxococcota bacterium]|nr:hypothetical protein [Myxococcota bacterium]